MPRLHPGRPRPQGMALMRGDLRVPLAAMSLVSVIRLELETEEVMSEIWL